MFLNSLSLARNGFKGVTETYKSQVLDVRASTWIWPQGSHSSLALLLPGTWNSELVGKFPFQQARKEFNLTHSQKSQQDSTRATVSARARGLYWHERCRWGELAQNQEASNWVWGLILQLAFCPGSDSFRLPCPAGVNSGQLPGLRPVPPVPPAREPWQLSKFLSSHR